MDLTNNIERENAMVNKMKWFDRTFSFNHPLDLYPNTVERLRGTPARLEERVRKLRTELLTGKDGVSWSIQENVGHVYDLESLWATRLDEFLDGAHLLSAADLQNKKTHEANHNASSIRKILKQFRDARELLVSRLDQLSLEEVSRTAMHPRLAQSMNVMDFAFFIAEHDDHHLARISVLMNTHFQAHTMHSSH